MGRRTDIKRAVTKEANTSPSPRPTPRNRRGLPLKTGCPIPEPLGCLIGLLVGENEEGRRLSCTNTACPHSNTLVHDRCLEAFEEHLVKILQNSGSARGWTDGQRRQNLWEKKGQALVGKVCRCRCGLGLVVRDERHDQTRELREKQAIEAQKGIKKKRTKRESALPRLNYGTKGQTLFPEPKVKGRTQYQSESESEISSFTSEYIASRRESMTLYKDTDPWASSSLNGTTLHDSVDETGDEFYQCYTPPASASFRKSFSDAIQRNFAAAGTSPSCLTAQKSRNSSPLPLPDRSSLTLPLTVQTENITLISARKGMRTSSGGMDSGIEIKSGATSLSEGDASTPPSESAQNSPPGYVNNLTETPLTTRPGRRLQHGTSRSHRNGSVNSSRKNSPTPDIVNKSSKSPPIVPGGTPAWRPLTPSLPPISAGSFDGGILGSSEPLSPLEELMRGLSQHAAKGDATMFDSAFARSKTIECDSSAVASISGRILGRPPGIPPLMSLQMTPPPEFIDRCPRFDDLFSSMVDLKGVKHSNKLPSTTSFATGSKILEKQIDDPISPSLITTTKKISAKVSISKKITGGYYFETATSNDSMSLPTQPDGEKRSVTPINWEDELPPEWVDMNGLPGYQLFGGCSSFMIGETIFGQHALPGHW